MSIDEMVAEYNEQEKAQQARLRAIFAAVKALPGYKLVDFENDVTWSNCWNGEDRFDGLYFTHLQREITRVEQG